MAFKEIRQFGRIAETTEIPNLTEIQKFSYAQFLQEDTPTDKRKLIGLEALLREIFPIVSYNEETQMEFHGYELGKARYTPDECRQLRLTYGKPFRIRCRLIRKDVEDHERLDLPRGDSIDDRGRGIYHQWGGTCDREPVAP